MQVNPCLLELVEVPNYGSNDRSRKAMMQRSRSVGWQQFPYLSTDDAIFIVGYAPPRTAVAVSPRSQPRDTAVTHDLQYLYIVGGSRVDPASHTTP